MPNISGLIPQLSEALSRPPGTLGSGAIPTPGDVSPDRMMLETLGDREGSMFGPMKQADEVRNFTEPELKASALQLSKLAQQFSQLDPDAIMAEGEANLNPLAKWRMRVRRAQDPLFDAKRRLQFQEVQANVLLKINEQLNTTVQQLRLLNPGQFAAEDEYGRAVGEAVGNLQAIGFKQAAINQLRSAGIPITVEQEQSAMRAEVGIKDKEGATEGDMLKDNLQLVESVGKTAMYMTDELMAQLPEHLQPVARAAKARERDRLVKTDRDQYASQLPRLYKDAVENQLAVLDAYGPGYFKEQESKSPEMAMFSAPAKRIPTLEALRTAQLRAYTQLKGLAGEKGIGTDEFEQAIGTTFESITQMTKEGIGAPVEQ